MSEQDPEQVKRVHKIRLEVAEAIFGKMLELTKKEDATREDFEKATMLANMWKTMSDGRIETTLTATLESFAEPLDARAMISDADVMFQAFERRLLMLSSDGQIHVREDFARFIEHPWRPAVVDKSEPNNATT